MGWRWIRRAILYIADTGNNRIRMVSASNGFITTIAGNGTLGNSGDYGPATSAELNSPTDVAVNSAGSVLVADGSGRIRVLTPAGGFPGRIILQLHGDSVDALGGGRRRQPEHRGRHHGFLPLDHFGAAELDRVDRTGGKYGAGQCGALRGGQHGASRSVTIAIAGVSVGVTQAGGQGSNNPCDINKDGVVDVADVQMLIKQSLGGLAGSNDLNGDGVVNAVDVQIDTNAALNLGCSANPAPREHN